ncbi:nucleoside recognition domain-containing protein [Mangrovicoccus ximenensis]|uniref:nucleoside recognition domain-containing protein n=1 Tax=Mangrovicoccus ximenensis TaxID=1911570 RepID=UPI000D33C7D4|nr:nucleoside recognition domain-containing protein [Mangrovicoccus ximenensis]
MEALVGAVLTAGENALYTALYIFMPLMVVLMVMLRFLEGWGFLSWLERVLARPMRLFGLGGLGTLAILQAQFVSAVAPVPVLAMMQARGHSERRLIDTGDNPIENHRIQPDEDAMLHPVSPHSRSSAPAHPAAPASKENAAAELPRWRADRAGSLHDVPGAPARQESAVRQHRHLAKPAPAPCGHRLPDDRFAERMAEGRSRRSGGGGSIGDVEPAPRELDPSDPGRGDRAACRPDFGAIGLYRAVHRGARAKVSGKGGAAVQGAGFGCGGALDAELQRIGGRHRREIGRTGLDTRSEIPRPPLAVHLSAR